MIDAVTPGATWTEGFIDSDGVSIHYVRTGDGTKPPIVMVHGFTDNARCWTRVASSLESDADVVMIDARNHGLSTAAVGTSVDMANDVAAVITALGLGSVGLIGHSLGATTAVDVAVQYPALIRRLVLEDPPWHLTGRHQPRSDKRRAALQAFIDSFAGLGIEHIKAKGREEHPSWHHLDISDWAQSKLEVRAEAIESITTHPWMDLVPQIACSTLLIHGEIELGGIVGPDLAVEVASRNPHVEIAPITGAGHNVRREAYEQYLSHLTRFLWL